MIIKKIQYILLLLVAVGGFVSCADDLEDGRKEFGKGEPLKGTLAFSLSMPEASVRTRSLNSS